MKVLRSLFAAACLMLAGALPAYAQNKTTVDEWTVFTNPDNCRAIATFAKGTTVSIALYQDGHASMMFGDNTRFATVEDTVPIEAELAFVNGEELDLKWAGTRVEGVVLGNGTKGAWLEVRAGKDFLATVAGADIFGLLRGDDALVSIQPGNPRALVEALGACAAKL